MFYKNIIDMLQNENELTSLINKKAIILIIFYNWFKNQIKYSKDLPKYWQSFIEEKETKYWFNELYDYIFYVEENYEIDDFNIIKILGGIKALIERDVLLKIELNSNLHKQLTKYLDEIRLNNDQKWNKLWEKKGRRRGFENWINQLMKKELINEILNTGNEKGEKIKKVKTEEEIKLNKEFLKELKEGILSHKIKINRFSSTFDLNENDLRNIFGILEIKHNNLRVDGKKDKEKDQIENITRRFTKIRIEENKIIKKERENKRRRKEKR
ncbi:hypothetical protein Mgra_00006946, partial [Meloidogyne graminicola]